MHSGLQFAALQKPGARAFHFVERVIDVARLEFDSAAAIDDDMRVQSELTRIEGAVLHTVIQRQTHEVDVLD